MDVPTPHQDPHHFAGAWVRGIALSIDHCLLFFAYGTAYVVQFFYPSKVVWSAASIALFVVIFGYESFFNARFGGTVGKLVCKLKIVRARDESPIGWREALLRIAVSGGINALSTFLSVWMTFQMPDSVAMRLVESLKNLDIQELLTIADRIPSAPSWVSLLMFFWYCGDSLSLVLSPRRQALHDRIAKTVVVSTKVATT